MLCRRLVPEVPPPYMPILGTYVRTVFSNPVHADLRNIEKSAVQPKTSVDSSNWKAGLSDVSCLC